MEVRSDERERERGWPLEGGEQERNGFRMEGGREPWRWFIPFFFPQLVTRCAGWERERELALSNGYRSERRRD